MRKSALFISAVLTTFMMAVLVGVVSNYQNKIKQEEAAAQTEEPVAVVEELPTATDLPAPTAAPAFITPEQAAALAAQVLGRTDLLSVETTVFNGQQAYLVKFIPGDMVYVSPTGDILSMVLAPAPSPTAVAASAPSSSSSGSNNNQGKGDRGGGGGGGGGDDDGGGGGDDD
ncbi:MAG: hypothetical protein AB1750_02425 [Chloroflexota bacterium]